MAIANFDLDRRMVGTVPEEVDQEEVPVFPAVGLDGQIFGHREATPIEHTILISSFSVDPMTRRPSSWSCFTRSARSWSEYLLRRACRSLRLADSVSGRSLIALSASL